MRKLRFFLLTALFILVHSPAFAESDAGAGRDSLVLLNYIAWWAHDDRGYHPAVTFNFQNETGDDLTDQLLRFQARFIEIRNNYLNVARDDIRRPLAKGQQSPPETLIGSEPYELSIDVNSWPQIECKVLYKISDEAEAHQLFLARVQAVTMTNEEAQQRLLQMPPRVIKSKGSKRKRKQETLPEEPVKPLSATALPLNSLGMGSGNSSDTQSGQGAIQSPQSQHSPHSPSNKNSKAEGTFRFKTASGLADDFFDFEQAFGRPASYEASTGKWTWAKYQPPGDVEIYAGARQLSSKADIILGVLKSKKPVPESQLIALGKEFLGKYRSQPLGNPVHTVRYLPAGRVQLATLAASAYHFSIYSTNDSADDNRYYIVVSRMPGSTEPLLLEQSKRSKLLKFMQPILGEAADQQ